MQPLTERTNTLGELKSQVSSLDILGFRCFLAKRQAGPGGLGTGTSEAGENLGVAGR